MAFLNDVNDVNAFLKSKGVSPVETTDSYRLTLTPEEIKQERAMTSNQQQQTESPERIFIHQVIQDVIMHYKLDETPGFYGDEDLDSTSVQQSIYYQVLNQKGILFEFYKKACHEQRQLDWIIRYEELYSMAVQDACALAN